LIFFSSSILFSALLFPFKKEAPEKIVPKTALNIGAAFIRTGKTCIALFSMLFREES
jgi:hypothetical protein